VRVIDLISSSSVNQGFRSFSSKPFNEFDWLINIHRKTYCLSLHCYSKDRCSQRLSTLAAVSRAQAELYCHCIWNSWSCFL